MNGKCHIVIHKNESNTQYVYHQCDGQPEDAGVTLVDMLTVYAREWEPVALAAHITETDGTFEHDKGIRGDEGCLYIIDCDRRALNCYMYDGKRTTGEIPIPGNTFVDRNLRQDMSAGHAPDAGQAPKAGSDMYWNSYIRIVAAMVPCWDAAAIPAEAKRLLDRCIDKVYYSNDLFK